MIIFQNSALIFLGAPAELLCDLFEASGRSYYGRDLIRSWSKSIDLKSKNIELVKKWGMLVMVLIEIEDMYICTSAQM